MELLTTTNPNPKFLSYPPTVYPHGQQTNNRKNYLQTIKKDLKVNCLVADINTLCMLEHYDIVWFM